MAWKAAAAALLLLSSSVLTSPSAPTTKCPAQRVSLPLETEVRKASVGLHLQYPDWNVGDFRHVADSHVPRFETRHSGTFTYGASYGTGRGCHLEAVEVLAPPMHFYQLDPETLRVREVAMEVQFHHTCESLDYFADRLNAIQAELDRLAQDEDDSLQALEKLVQDASSAAAKGEAALKAAREAAERMKRHIEAVRANIRQQQHEKQVTKDGMQYEESYHRLPFSKRAVISLLLHIDNSEADDSLLEFLTCAGGGQCGEGHRHVQGPRRWLSGLSPTAYHYRGTPTQAPCNETADWFVLGKRLTVSHKAFSQVRTKGNGSIGEGSDLPDSVEMNLTEIELVGVDDVVLRPKFSFEEKGSRAIRFGGAVAAVLVVGTAIHALTLFPYNDGSALLALVLLPLLVFVACDFSGCIHFPAPPGDYGFWEAWGSVAANAAGSWWRVLITLAHVGLGFVLVLYFDSLLVIPVVPLAEAVVLALVCIFRPAGEVFGFYFSTLIYGDFVVFLLALASWALALLCLFYTLGFSLVTPSLLAPAALLLLYFLLAQVPALVSLCSAFAATYPLATCLLKLAWFGIPVTLVMLLAPWFILPYTAWASGAATCTDGFDWEIHLTFALVLLWLSVLWGTLRQGRLGAKRVWERALTFGLYMLALLDMYTDSVFIIIAFSCGSSLGWWAVIFYCMGVLLFQLIGPAVTTLCSEPNAWGSVLALWTLLLFPAELLGGGKQGYQPLEPAEVEELDRVDNKRIKFTILIQAVLRLAAEDLPQCVLQYLFTIYVKRNGLIVFSICISIASSLFAVGKAVYNYQVS